MGLAQGKVYLHGRGGRRIRAGNSPYPGYHDLLVQVAWTESTRIWGDRKCISVICRSLYIGPALSPQVRSCIAASTILQVDMACWRRLAPLGCWKVAGIFNTTHRNICNGNRRGYRGNTLFISPCQRTLSAHEKHLMRSQHVGDIEGANRYGGENRQSLSSRRGKRGE